MSNIVQNNILKIDVGSKHHVKHGKNIPSMYQTCQIKYPNYCM